MLNVRMGTWVGLVVMAGGLLVAAAAGMWGYLNATATPLHPQAEAVPAQASSDSAPRWADATERARRAMRAGITQGNLPGVSVAVGVGREIVWAEGFGWADLERRVPVSPDTRFRIGTASTVLTSAAVGLLVERGRLDLDQEIQTYVPAFPKKSWPVTLRQVLGHVAGVRTDGGDEGPYTEHCDRPADALRIFGHQSLLFEPGTDYRYSSYGWVLVSAAIEAVAGEPFLTFMRQEVFAPLGMDDTRADTREPLANAATFYFPRFGADPRYGLHLMRELDYSCYAGASVFLSTPSDLVRFGSGINSGEFLQPGTVTLLQTSLRLPSGQETGYGLGWDLETVTLNGVETRVVGHDGDSLGGMVASLLTFPEHGLVVAVTSNISYAKTFDLAVRVAEAFVESVTPTPRR